jgi:tRNA(fMet)-specific endonuclease VapC
VYQLDTDICIYLIKKKPVEVLKRFQEINVGDISISSITLSELIFGVRKSQYPDKNLKALEKFIISLEVLSYNTKTAYVYGNIKKALESNGTPIGPMDALIAAHAISYKNILITNNEREFNRVPGLKVENWVS